MVYQGADQCCTFDHGGLTRRSHGSSKADFVDRLATGSDEDHRPRRHDHMDYQAMVQNVLDSWIGSVA